jgi:crotonobetaine/carnitine-CoA ligase
MKGHSMALPTETADFRFPPMAEVVVPDLLDRRAAETPSRPFAVFADETWDYARAAAEAWSAARALRGLGVERGDFVLAWLPNGKDALRVWFGANALGATFAPLNPAYRGSLLEHTINIAGARLMVAHPALLDRLEGLELPALEQIVAVAEGPVSVAGRAVLGREALDDPGPRPDVDGGVNVWDIAALIYTSGTTGPSKGVLCPYLHHYTYAEGLLPTQTGNDRFYVCLPMFHAGGTTAIYGMLQRGGSVAIVDGFRTQAFFDDARRFGVTHCTILGAMATFLLKQDPRDDDLDNPIRTAIVTPMVDDPAAFTRRFGIEVFTGYGLTEGTCPIRSEYTPENTFGCGCEWNPDYELRIVDEHDREVAPGQVGELMMRHSRPWSLSAGYRKMPEETARAWRNGWFHTGDAMRRDPDGTYVFVDRAKDALRRRGENISSMEVEREILAHPSVLEAAVVAAPADEVEDEVRAFVAARPGAVLDPRELAEWLVPRLPYFMVPRYIDVLDELPKTESQKVQKYKLRDRPLDGSWDREEAGMRLRSERLS